MKRITYLSMLIIFSLILLSACEEQSNNPASSNQNETTVLAKAGGPSVNGQATITYEGTDLRRIITFHAKTDANGMVKGQGVLNKVSSDSGSRLHLQFDIDCLNVNGNTAIVSGIITKSSDPFYTERTFQFKIVDNGEGANAEPDLITHMANWGPDEESFDCGQDVG